ncbi:MAG: glycosyltransferase family 4 protein [Ignavibacteria bacterium]
MIKVCQIVSGQRKGGIDTVQKNLHAAFTNDNAGIFFKTIVIRNHKNDFEEFYSGEAIYINYGSYLPVYLQLRKVLKQFDIIHVHGFTPWLVLAIRLINRRILFSNHGLMGKGRILGKKEKFKKFLFGIFLRNIAECIVSVSDFINRKMIVEYGVNEEKTAIVHNCTNFPVTERLVKKNKTLVLGYHGRFVSFKRLKLMIDVSSEINKTHSSMVSLLGEGPEMKELVSYAKLNNIELKVNEYAANVFEHIRNFDYLLFTSHGEAFGITVLESIMSGIPAFVFNDSGGTLEIFAGEYSWFICKDTKDMAEKVIKFGNDEIYGLLFAKLQKHVENNFSLSAFKKSYARIYNDFLSK